MNQTRLKYVLVAAVLLAVLLIGLGCSRYVKLHTFTLSGDAPVKSERIQPVTGSVKVTGTTDTEVVFTDTESGERYVISYITSGAGDTIRLERGKWRAPGRLRWGPSIFGSNEGGRRPDGTAAAPHPSH